MRSGATSFNFAGALVIAAALLLGLTVALDAQGAVVSGLSPHPEVRGEGVAAVDVRPAGGSFQSTSWGALAETVREPGRYQVSFRVEVAMGGEAIQIPPCAGRGRVRLDGRSVEPLPAGPVVIPVAQGSHEVVLDLDVSRYERRIACGEAPRVGPPDVGIEGLSVFAFPSPHAAQGGGKAVVYVPPGHDVHRPSPLLVGAHPWNGSVWTYAAYPQLLRAARDRDVLLLMPSGLGNSLYTAPAEDEVMRAITALSSAIAVNPRAVSIWGASMGGAGATTIGLHHPDHFASITSFFGDSQYDLKTYVRSILTSEHAAHLVNACDVADNARHVPVWLIHGEDDATSPIRQSELLAAVLEQRGFAVRFDRVAGMGHSGRLVARKLPELVALAVRARTPATVDRVTYKSVRPSDLGAYGVRIERSSAVGDAFVDVERRVDGVHVIRQEGVRAIFLARGALGTSSDQPPPIVMDDPRPGVRASWEGALP